MAEMIALNPSLASTLISAGERAGQFWLYVTGARPHGHAKVRQDSYHRARKSRMTARSRSASSGPKARGSRPPVRMRYRWLAPAAGVVAFDDIVWPPDVIIPWGKSAGQRNQRPVTNMMTCSSALLIRYRSIGFGSISVSATFKKPVVHRSGRSRPQLGLR
jgi:hypothetical protein